ncbi:TetR family transcriptional regulator [Phycicoccus sp. CSK15P-2]|uniref:TetR/AcrR family transcriptional regulator n=1 Tax=Phycicoccus sp. CSK15P-2 TaxID=2807627 RepID=UPI00194E53D6|nr:TetR/AcrR family transcriptional regulator [Phycicoccus sp. CSK15P-2]MBM6402631.1 TetR family transcriptional regulator [Phycicoccus sp. CSK15P-2]
MARWEPGTAARLQQAAMELFTSQGFERTTAAEIAAACGVTERTFFRHFTDKRDVLFRGQDEFERVFVDALDTVSPGVTPMKAVMTALRGGASWFDDERRPHSRMRQGVIDANPPLQERERHKLAGLADTLAGALRARGVPEPAATLAAQTGTTVFGVAFGQWIADGETRPLDAIADDVLRELTALTGEA